MRGKDREQLEALGPVVQGMLIAELSQGLVKLLVEHGREPRYRWVRWLNPLMKRLPLVRRHWQRLAYRQPSYITPEIIKIALAALIQREPLSKCFGAEAVDIASMSLVTDAMKDIIIAGKQELTRAISKKRDAP